MPGGERSGRSRLVFRGWALLVLSFAAASGAIIVRHDVPDESYRDLAESCRGIVLMNTNEPGGPPDGVGTLVSPRWVVTAAHIAALLRPGHVVTVGGRDMEVAEIVIHPEWDDGPHDIALVRLSGAVDWEEPLARWRHGRRAGLSRRFLPSHC